jgi:hypothetical protein
MQYFIDITNFENVRLLHRYRYGLVGSRSMVAESQFMAYQDTVNVGPIRSSSRRQAAIYQNA